VATTSSWITLQVKLSMSVASFFISPLNS
jgi:hypothetical protein